MFDEYVSLLLILFSHQINICISTKGHSKSLSLFVFLVVKVRQCHYFYNENIYTD